MTDREEYELRKEVLEGILHDVSVHGMVREIYSSREQAWDFLDNNEGAMEDALEHYSDKIEGILRESADEEQTRSYEEKHAHD